jgi:C4-dicarboxylate-specific signal transduction histidine kinase
VMASSDRDQAAPPNSDRSASWFQQAIAGEAGYYFAFDAAARRPYYYASYPVRDDNGSVIGVAVLQKSFDAFDASSH